MSSIEDSTFTRHFGEAPDEHYFSPGRINLIGEHTDYNDGWVLPVAVHLGTHFDVRRSDDGHLRIHSTLMDETIDLPVESRRRPSRRGDWSDYFTGVVNELFEIDCEPCGLDIVVTSTMPVGSGLSSSASIGVGLASILNDEWHAHLSRMQLALLAKRSENHFVGLSCGILDHVAVSLSEAARALLLDCGKLEYEKIPFPDDRYALIAFDTGVRRRLLDSGYNARRAECELALALIRTEREAASLSALGLADVEASESLKSDSVALRRARHVVSENERVRSAAEALGRGDIDTLGSAMYASHVSLSSDYEVSCRELDLAVDLAERIDGVKGAKMTGAGFGGSAVVLVEQAAAESVAAELTDRYIAAIDHQPRASICRLSAGTHKL